MPAICSRRSACRHARAGEELHHVRRGRPDRKSVLAAKGLLVMLLDLDFRRLMICVRAVKTDASYSAGIVNVGAQHVPALAKMQHPVMLLRGPTPRCDSNPFFLGHLPHPLWKSLWACSKATETCGSEAGMGRRGHLVLTWSRLPIVGLAPRPRRCMVVAADRSPARYIF